MISLDLRYNALPLYLSRPVTRLDYFLGKLGVIAALVAAVAVLPAAAAYVLGVCFSLDLTVVRDTWRLLPASILYGLVIVVSAGTLMLALSSMSRRSLYVGLTWVGLFLIGWVVAGVLGMIHHEALRSAMRKHRRAARRIQRTLRQPADLPRVDERTLTGGERRSEVPSQGRPMPRATTQSGNRLAGPAELQQAESEARKTDWRPLFSYTANLHRLGEAILDTDAAWVQIGRAYERRRSQVESMSGRSPGPWTNNYHPEPANERRLAEIMGAAISLDLVGRRPGRPLGTFPMHLEHASEIAGPPAMNAVVEFDGVSKWYGNVIGLNKLTRADRAGRHRPARPQRGRQIDHAATGHRAASPQPGAGPRARPSRPGTTPR